MSRIYLDYQATTPLDPQVWAAMKPFFLQQFGNPGSIDTERGQAAAQMVETARGQLAGAIGALPRDVIFTSGATEANNLALKGAMVLQVKKGRPRILTFASEHKCVLAATQACAEFGAEPEVLPVQPDGLIDLDNLAHKLDQRVGMISAMAVHNEIGVIQNFVALGDLAQRHGALFHCDMAQALGKIPIDLGRLPIALASFSAHKAYGPMGIGALYIRRRPKAHVAPQVHGGGQERGVRSGTLPLPLIVGFGAAAAQVSACLESDLTRAWELREKLMTLVDHLPQVHVNGHRMQRVPSNFNLRFDGLSQAEVRAGLAEFEFSRGSACSAADLGPSATLTALGLNEVQADSAVRLSLGRFTTAEDIDALCAALARIGKTEVAGTAPRLAVPGDHGHQA